MSIEDLGKWMVLWEHLSTMWRNIFPRLVLTLQFHGGLYQVMFLCRFLLRFLLGVCMGCWLYVNL